MIGTIKISELTPTNTANKLLYADTDFDSLYKIEGISKDCNLICSYKVTGLTFPVQRTFMAHRGENVIIADKYEPEIAIQTFLKGLQEARRARMSNLFL